MNRGSLLNCAVIGALLFASGAAAQTTASDENRVETVIVTGRKVTQDKVPMKVTFTQSTINEEQILNVSPATSIQTLLGTEPSVYVEEGGPNGMETTIKLRAFDDGEFGETFAGVPLNDIFNSGVTGQAAVYNNNLLVPRDLEGVELYRGVNNPAVNTYNSLGGTINFQPRQPTADMGGDVGVDGGSFGSLDWHVTLNTGDWNGIEQTLTIERDFSSGWIQNTPDQNDNLYYAGKVDLGKLQLFDYLIYNHNEGDAPSDVPIDLLKANGIDWNWPKSINASEVNDTYYMGIFGGKYQVNSYISVEDEAYASDDNFHRVGFSNYNYTGPYYLFYEGEKSWYLSNLASAFPEPGYGGQAYGNTLTSHTTKYAYAATDYHYYGYTGSTYGDRVRFDVDLPFNDIIAGGDFNVGELHSREYLYGSYYMPTITGYNDWWDEHDTRQMWSAFVQDDIHFFDDRIHITPGIKYIGAVSKDNDALGYYYDPPGSLSEPNHFLSPTIGASFEAMQDLTVYASFGKNVKFPDITALYEELGYSTNNPQPTVQPEYALDYEAGVRYKMDNLQAEVNVYQENFSHIIYTETLADGADFFLNGGSERYQGVETQLIDDFGEWWVGNWKGYLNASYNNAVCTSTTQNYYTDSSCNKGQGLADVPNYLLNAGVTWDWSGWHVDLKGRFVGDQHLENYSSGLPEQPSQLAPGEMSKIPDYFIVNAAIVKVVPIEGVGPFNALRFALHVDNLFDKQYYTDAFAHYTNYTNGDYTYGRPGSPRAVYGSISVYF